MFEIMELFVLFANEFYLVLLVLNLEIICLQEIVFCQGVLSSSLGLLPKERCTQRVRKANIHTMLGTMDFLYF